MDDFSYLSVLLAIVVGLAVTQVLQGYRGIALGRAQTDFYWPVLVLSGLLFIILVQTWWAMFGLRAHRDWTFPQFFVVILHTVLLYMQAALVFPDFQRNDVIGLRAHYLMHSRLIFTVAILSTLASLAKDVALDGHLPHASNLAFHVLFIVIAASAIAVQREWYHKVLGRYRTGDARRHGWRRPARVPVSLYACLASPQRAVAVHRIPIIAPEQHPT